MKTKTTQTTLGFKEWAKVKYLITDKNKISKLKH